MSSRGLSVLNRWVQAAPRRRMRGTVAGCTLSAPGIVASDQPGPPSPCSALRKMRARGNMRAGAIPEPTNLRK
jgi:hypothetical protein